MRRRCYVVINLKIQSKPNFLTKNYNGTQLPFWGLRCVDESNEAETFSAALGGPWVQDIIPGSPWDAGLKISGLSSE